MGGIAVIDTSTVINIRVIGRYDIIERLKYSLCTTIYVVMELTSSKARPETREFFYKLVKAKKITHVQLSIEDLVEMSKVPNGSRISDAELSCFVKAKTFGCKTFCDDRKAIKHAEKYITLGEIIGIKGIIIEAYEQQLISDHEVLYFQKLLNFLGDLLFEAAQARFMKSSS